MPTPRQCVFAIRAESMNKEAIGFPLFLLGLGAVPFGVIQMQQGWSEDSKLEQPAFVKAR